MGGSKIIIAKRKGDKFLKSASERQFEKYFFAEKLKISQTAENLPEKLNLLCLFFKKHDCKKMNIVKFKEEHRDQILKVWEDSVLKSHDFLNPDDFQEIKKLVNSIDFNDLEVYCLIDQNKVHGFIGVADQNIEMLFIAPSHFGQGLGKRLVNFAILELEAKKVDVNEQNRNAVGFYQKLGFQTFERTELDDQGRNYPLLRMKL